MSTPITVNILPFHLSSQAELLLTRSSTEFQAMKTHSRKGNVAIGLMEKKNFLLTVANKSMVLELNLHYLKCGLLPNLSEIVPKYRQERQ